MPTFHVMQNFLGNNIKDTLSIVLYLTGIFPPQFYEKTRKELVATPEVKVLAKLDIADRLRPQDGKARVQVKTRGYDLRVSTIPAGGAVSVRVHSGTGTRMCVTPS